MNTLDVQPGPARDALLVHEAGHIRRSNVLGPVAEMISDLFHPHLSGHGRVRHAERAAETAAIIGPVQGHQDEPLDLREQVSEPDHVIRPVNSHQVYEVAFEPDRHLQFARRIQEASVTGDGDHFVAGTDTE
jgi:hypothetical protein